MDSMRWHEEQDPAYFLVQDCNGSGIGKYTVVKRRKAIILIEGGT